jgi:tetratricopeptide (TPR) repeat protein
VDRQEMQDVLVRAARRILAKRGPLTLEELAAALTAEGLELGADPVELLDDVLLGEERTFALPDGRVVDVESLLNGLTLTHRLREDEVGDEFVLVEPDLSPLLAAEVEALPLAGGGAARFFFPERHEPVADDECALADECMLIGSAGWLGDAIEGDLLAFHLDDGCLCIGPVEGELADPIEAAERFARAFDEASEDGRPVEGCDLVVIALADAPELLRRPLPPLEQVYADAGLETYGAWVGLTGQDWSALDEDLKDAITAWSQQVWGLDEVEAEALGILLGAYGLVTNGGTQELTADPQMVAILGQMLSIPNVAEAFVGSVLGLDPDEEPAVAAFAQFLADAGGESAGAHYTLSCCAEYRGDVAAGEKHLAAALAIDPEFEPALMDAAWYAEDRGDAARALGYLRKAGIDADDDDDHILRLKRFAARGPATAGRNEPCPCGSGRKYKVCCAQRHGHPLHERAGWLQHKASAFLLRPAQRSVLRRVALARTGLPPEDPEWISVALDDPLIQDLALFDTDVFAAFLDVRGELLPADELELGRSWVGLARSLYEVTDVRPGEGLQLRDLRTGERLDVTERLGSQALAPGMLLYARVVPDGRSHQLLAGTTTIPFTLRDRLLAFLDTKPGPEEVAAWFAAAEAPPTLVNREGEPTVLYEARYVVADPADAQAALAEVLDVVGDRFVEHVEVDGQTVVRGWVRCDGDELVVETNSVERFARLCETVTNAVPDAMLLAQQRTPATEVLAQQDARPGEEAMPLADAELPPQAIEWLNTYMVSMEERWIDERVPALGGVTPREAANDPTRRGDLEALLNQFETESAPLPGGVRSFDPDRLRHLLGLRPGQEPR